MKRESLDSILYTPKKNMLFTLTGTDYTIVGPVNDRVGVDGTWFNLREGIVSDNKGRHVYTLHFDTKTIEPGKDYEPWNVDDQVPVCFNAWRLKACPNQNPKNVIIGDTVYQIKNATYLWPRPKLYLHGKLVGRVREGVVVWGRKAVS